MENLFREGSLFSFVNTTGGAVTLTCFCIVVLFFMIIIKITGLNLFGLCMVFLRWLMHICGGFINKKETMYHRDLEVGKINEKRNTVKIYRFLNDLIIDLGLKQKGATPYEFLFIVAVCVLFGTIALCQILFGSLLMVIVMYPIVFAGVICVLYTKANLAHDTRIESVIEAENIICNNIAGGVLAAVKGSIDVIPSQVRMDFKDFIDNVEHKNYHIRTALMELNNHLGSVADDFIKKCIVFEMEEEHGIVGMFKDIVEINNVKMEMRTEMKRRFEEVKVQFIIGAIMIFLFLGGVIAIYPDVAYFYLKMPIGQIILALDLLIMVAEFVFITYLRAKEL